MCGLVWNIAEYVPTDFFKGFRKIYSVDADFIIIYCYALCIVMPLIADERDICICIITSYVHICLVVINTNPKKAIQLPTKTLDVISKL